MLMVVHEFLWLSIVTGWTGPTQCGTGWTCTYNNDYFSQCLYTGDTTKNQPYGQCGGRGWTGSTECSKGYYCAYSNEFFSQCLPN
ncbi:hypothetical protein EXIGLDRAFT_774097 [Exidia glandulosa HHB12029]|uniref:CBM1 domain-containing protein n=1 Tax=Exidia glandulosa HHB12029 TaxID=1314781 RepID=A0A165EHS1_EXIGL|nr:hypothetical protein EXIGLDRAFT_774094 [Exidia glandulosa HHB12029]KZV86966.1 hypothetical protein EXIGLDRAFT_774097 [Exidia glandulosa HHB12029]